MGAVWSELQTIGALHVGVERVGDFLGGDINNGDCAFLRVGDPDFFAVGRDVKSLGAVADLDHSFVPIAAGRSKRKASGARRSFFDYGNRARAYVGGDDVLEIVEEVNHVGAILPGAENPIDLLRGGIVAADGFGSLDGEPELAAFEVESVWAL